MDNLYLFLSAALHDSVFHILILLTTHILPPPNPLPIVPTFAISFAFPHRCNVSPPHL